MDDHNPARRTFLKTLGLSLPTFLLSHRLDGDSVYSPLTPTALGFQHPLANLEQARNSQGQIMLRLEMAGSRPTQMAQLKAHLKAENATISRVRNYFFEPEEDSFTSADVSWRSQANSKNVDVIVIWMDEVSENSRITISDDDSQFTFSLGELLQQKEISQILGGARVKVNFLLDHEIGEILLRDVKVPETGDNFSFVVMTDPQGGDPTDTTNDSTTRLKIHNAFIEESIKLTNKVSPPPAFSLILGDIVDSQGQKSNYDTMLDFFERLKMPVLFELGNHETTYRVNFSPGYNLQAFANYFTAQKQINGLEKLLYSFNAGRWHFIVWPDPLRGTFWETHPHYFDWLERDLEKHQDRPTMFFQHIPIHPIGINPMVNYVESVEVKRTLLNLLSRHGNVKYVLSGHVHIPLKASLKTARTYKGMNLINLPAAGYRPRSFGEEDFHGGPSQGIAIVNIRGEKAVVKFQSVTGETFTYPETFPEFIPDQWPLWLNHKWELPVSKNIINGNFQQGFQGWARRFVYQEDNSPSHICEIRNNSVTQNRPALYLFCRARGYHAPGQDRLPQSINHLCQAVSLKPQTAPLLRLSYLFEGTHFDPERPAGAYLWLEGFQGSYKRLSLIYSLGPAYTPLGGKYSQPYMTSSIHYDLTAPPDVWHKVTLNLKKDFERKNSNSSFTDTRLDHLVVNLGVWTENEEKKQKIGIYFTDLTLSAEPLSTSTVSTVDDQPVLLKKPQDLWRKGIDHVAGEHKLIDRRNRK